MGSHDVTDLLVAWHGGEGEALERLIPLVHDELHRLAQRYMAGERAGHPLQPTALVNEAYLRLIDSSRVRWQDRTHFFAVAAHVVRAVLVDHARARLAAKRGAGAITVTLTDVHAASPAPTVDFVDLDAALRSLEALDPEQVRIVELRYFAGLSIDETAAALRTSPSTVKRGWLAAKTYIRRRLDGRGAAE